MPRDSYMAKLWCVHHGSLHGSVDEEPVMTWSNADGPHRRNSEQKTDTQHVVPTYKFNNRKMAIRCQKSGQVAVLWGWSRRCWQCASSCWLHWCNHLVKCFELHVYGLCTYSHVMLRFCFNKIFNRKSGLRLAGYYRLQHCSLPQDEHSWLLWNHLLKSIESVTYRTPLGNIVLPYFSSYNKILKSWCHAPTRTTCCFMCYLAATVKPLENQECAWPRVTERLTSSDSKLDYPVAVV